MRIGEVARRTGTTPRLLRYYEAQGLIAPGRAENGYREYDEDVVGRVSQVRELLRAGLPTRLIVRILPCLATPRDDVRFSGVTPETVALLEAEHARLTARIDCLTRNRDAIGDYLTALYEAGPARDVRARDRERDVPVPDRGERDRPAR
jgi:DNA-binding transcriptional MerR regulator